MTAPNAKAYGHTSLESALDDARVYARNLDVPIWVVRRRHLLGVAYCLTENRPEWQRPVAVVRPTADGRGWVHVYARRKDSDATRLDR